MCPMVGKNADPSVVGSLTMIHPASVGTVNTRTRTTKNKDNQEQ